ncbi:hypothetical protein [Sphingomonas guangdongensis]|uniref:hypothetical protein n=1 Tax=Sphingomonas guangdongensis TaxID=1141890 RepID=UPI0015CEA7BD|nr:hypothetical protein [Sphingomonas guangdongensis]
MAANLRFRPIVDTAQAATVANMNSLRLLYRTEDVRHGELSTTVESGDFRGVGSAWFTIEQLREFWRMAGAYPISEREEPHLAGGYWDDSGETLRQCHLSIRLSPHDRQGSIRVTVALASPAERGEAVDLHQAVTTRFRATYGDIDRFRAAFGAMLDGNAGDATLEGTAT